MSHTLLGGCITCGQYLHFSNFSKLNFYSIYCSYFYYKSMIIHLIIILPGCKSWHTEVVDDVGMSIIPDKRQSDVES